MKMLPVTSSSSPHFPFDYLEGEEEVDEMVVAYIVWNPDAVTRFLEKWDNANFAAPPPFNRPANAEEFHRRMLEHLTQNITGASVVDASSVNCNTLSLALLTVAMGDLHEEQWVRNIIDAEPVGWDSPVGALNVPYGNKVEHVRFHRSFLFD